MAAVVFDLRIFKIICRQCVVNGRLQPSQLIPPGIHIEGGLPETQLFVNMPGPRVFRSGIQHNFLTALLKQSANQQPQDDFPNSTVLTVCFADLDANFGCAGRSLPVNTLSD